MMKMRSRSRSSNSSYPGKGGGGGGGTLSPREVRATAAAAAADTVAGGMGNESLHILRDFVRQLIQIALKTRVVQKGYAKSIETFGFACDMPLDPVGDEKKITWLFSAAADVRRHRHLSLSVPFPSQKTSPTLSPDPARPAPTVPTITAIAAQQQQQNDGVTKRAIYLSIYLQDDREQMGLLECLEFEYTTTTTTTTAITTTATEVSSTAGEGEVEVEKKKRMNALLSELGRELRAFYLYMTTRRTRSVAYELLRDCSSPYRIHYELSVKRPFWDARHYTQEAGIGGCANVGATMAVCCGGSVRVRYTEWLGRDKGPRTVDALFAALMKDATGRTFSPRRHTGRRISMGAGAVPRPNFKVDDILSAAAAYGSAPQQGLLMSSPQWQRLHEYYPGRSDAEQLSYRVPPLPFLSRQSVAPGSSELQTVPTSTSAALGSGTTGYDVYGLGLTNNNRNRSALGVSVGVKPPPSFSRPVNIPRGSRDEFFQLSSLPQPHSPTQGTLQTHPFAAAPFTPPSNSQSPSQQPLTPSSPSSSSSSSSSFGLGRLAQPDDGNFCVLPSSPRDITAKQKRSWAISKNNFSSRNQGGSGTSTSFSSNNNTQGMAAKTQTSDCPGLGLGLGDAGECSYDYALGRDTTKLGLWEDNREEELDLFTIVTNPPEHMFRNTNNNNNTSTNVAQLLKTINSKALLEKSSHA